MLLLLMRVLYSVAGDEVRPQSDGYVYMSGTLYESVN